MQIPCAAVLHVPYGVSISWFCVAIYICRYLSITLTVGYNTCSILQAFPHANSSSGSQCAPVNSHEAKLLVSFWKVCML